MGLFNRSRSAQTAKERGQLRRRLRELEEQREQAVRDLGGLTLEMHKRDRFESGLLSDRAARIAALDSEANLVRRALKEGLTLGELKALAHPEANLGPAAEPRTQ